MAKSKEEKQALYSDVLKRMHEALDAVGLPKRGRNGIVAQKTGYSLGMVGKILSGHTEITDRFIRAFCWAFRLREEWVSHGTGDQLLTSTEIENIIAEETLPDDFVGLVSYELKLKKGPSFCQVRGDFGEISKSKMLTLSMCLGQLSRLRESTLEKIYIFTANCAAVDELNSRRGVETNIPDIH